MAYAVSDGPQPPNANNPGSSGQLSYRGDAVDC